MTRLRKKRKISLKREKAKNYKVTLNALTAGNKNITLKTATRNRSRIEKLRRRLKPQTRNGNRNRKSIPKENGTK
jgi:hypothetical protein